MSHFTSVAFSFPADKVGHQACLPVELSQDWMGSWYTYPLSLPSPEIPENIHRGSPYTLLKLRWNNQVTPQFPLSQRFLTEPHPPASASSLGRGCVMHTPVTSSVKAPALFLKCLPVSLSEFTVNSSQCVLVIYMPVAPESVHGTNCS